ncbi:hypothetical protein [Thalassotalea agarivorans]|uniref:Uncharacterized protein n=1 Tax=Thalassotalea agarivorans TaxID=349064 RepID=A0A1I0CPJ8_THASX|nr:hypothetical protein [Thalassotalea agarivorans]SET21519.1 hypothetical protein SAMN05660429_01278 [Thalassotalea agarivorans]
MFTHEDANERRQLQADKALLWSKLSLAQKFAASNLTQFGYDLAFIRSSGAGAMAVLMCNEAPATIANDGEIDTSPDINLRSA